MLYRLHPQRTVEWCDVPLELSRIEELKAEGVDLDRLDWQPSERPFDDDDLRVALRSGRPSRAGLIVDASDLEVLDYPRRIRAVHASGHDIRTAYRRELEKMEQVFPGMLAADDASTAAVDASREEILARADREVSKTLGVAASPGLVSHWTNLGGRLPEPV